MEPICLIFSAVCSTRTIASFIGLVESTDANISKLRHRDFNSAIENLKYAQSCQTLESAANYIETARVRFIDSLSLEENENKIDAFVGLAMCQHLQGNDNLALLTLKRIQTEVELTRSEKNNAIAYDIGVASLGYDPQIMVDPAPSTLGLYLIVPRLLYHTTRAIMNPKKYPNYVKRCKQFEERKKNAIEGIKILS
ncbi:MAG: hypothetical protein MJZ20_04660 [Bacteroidaceae bacterium]|nr:hypothetical protein [Bacteroidaceae bacterium]